jgi:hypothetical protein
VFLEIADVRDYARIKLNGKELEAHAWQPYRWDVTGALNAGSNDLEIQVVATPSGRGGAGGAAPAVAAPVPTPPGGFNRVRGVFSPPVSGLLGPVWLVVR